MTKKTKVTRTDPGPDDGKSDLNLNQLTDSSVRCRKLTTEANHDSRETGFKTTQLNVNNEMTDMVDIAPSMLRITSF